VAAPPAPIPGRKAQAPGQPGLFLLTTQRNSVKKLQEYYAKMRPFLYRGLHGLRHPAVCFLSSIPVL
jgi:hypothetical protein